MSTTTTTTINLNTLLEKTTHYDKDERYMATSDLCTSLSSGIVIDEIMEKKICSAILKQLDDKSNDVQSMAVKCLGTLLKKVKHAQVSEISIKLSTLILTGQSELRDIYSIGLKTLISDVPESMGPLVVERLTDCLINGINNDNDDIKRESLDNMTDLLKRFGHLMKNHHETILTIVIRRLESDKPVVRKRASVCLGALATVVSDNLLLHLVNDLLRRISSLDISSKLTTNLADDIRIIIQTIGTISRTVGYRLGKSLDQIIPLFIKCCGGTSSSSESQELFYNDLREHCFPGLESFILRCPNEISPHISAILELSLFYMKYDPNYCYDDDNNNGDDDNDNNDEDDEDNDGDDDEYGGSDDDDSSWKIRKATIKVIQAIVISRVEIIQQNDLFFRVANELLGRLKEREESVRIEIVNCLTALFHTALQYTNDNPIAEMGLPHGPPALTTQRSTDYNDGRTLSSSSNSNSGSGSNSTLSTQELNPEIIYVLQSKLSFILRLSRKQLSSQSLKIKSPIYKMLEVLVKLLKGSFESELSVLLEDVVKYMNSERTEGVKYSALLFLQAVFQYHTPEIVQPYLPLVIPVIVKYCRDDWYKITTASLKMLEQLIVISKSTSSHSESMDIVGQNSSPVPTAIRPFIPTIYQIILYRLEANDIDHEIKESAISSSSQFLTTFGNEISQEERNVLVALLQRRLENELLRISALKAFSKLSSQSNINLHISSQLNTILRDISLFLKQNNRLLKQTTLITIYNILKSQLQQSETSSEITINTIQAILKELLVVMNENDINIIDTTLQILKLVFQNYLNNSTILSYIQSDVLPRVYDLACSSWIYGIARNSLISLLELLCQLNINNLTFNELEQQLISHYEQFYLNNGGNNSNNNSNNTNNSNLQVLSTSTSTSTSASSSDSGTNIKQSLTNLARCISSICLISSVDIQHNKVLKYITVLEKHTSESSSSSSSSSSSLNNTTQGDLGNLSENKYFTLLCLGFIGQRIDIRPILGSKSENLDTILFHSLSSDSDDMKSLISNTLGSLSIGNLSYYIPLIQQELNRNASYKYYLLMALREIFIISIREKINLNNYIENIVDNLFQYLSSDIESIRNILAECIGYLAVLSPQNIIFQINEKIGSNQSEVFTLLTLSNSMKYFFSRYVVNSSNNQTVLPSFLPLINLLTYDNLEIKKSVIQTINSAIHYNHILISNYLTSNVIELIIQVLSIKAERIIDLGPFKHRIDDALPLRKVSLTCCETILSVNPRSIDSRLLIESLIQLLVDNKDETNLQSHQILSKLCDTDPGAVLCVIDRIIDPIEKSMIKNVAKESSTAATEAPPANVQGGTNAAPASTQSGPEAERAYEQLRSCVRLIKSINTIPDITTNRRWQDFLSKILQKKSIAAMMDSSEIL